MQVSIVIPAYNEDLIIEDNILDLLSYCKNNLGNDFKIIISDNNSTDQTAEISKKLSETNENIDYLFIQKQGKGAAVICGWKKYEADVYCFMDADMAVNLESLIPLIVSISIGGDISIGSRYIKGSRVNNYFSDCCGSFRSVQTAGDRQRNRVCYKEL